MGELWRMLRDPRLSTLLVLGGAVIAGFLLMAYAATSSATLTDVPLQVPWLVSGGMAGLGLVGTGLGLISIHLDRVEAAEERRQLAELQREALRLQGRRGAGE